MKPYVHDRARTYLPPRMQDGRPTHGEVTRARKAMRGAVRQDARRAVAAEIADYLSGGQL